MLGRQLADTKERLLGFPPRLREARHLLLSCRTALKPLREQFAEREGEIRLEVQMEPAEPTAPGVTAKLRYTNDVARNTETKARVAKDVRARSFAQQLAQAERAMEQVEIDLQSVEDERTALKWYLDATIAEVQLATFRDPAS